MIRSVPDTLIRCTFVLGCMRASEEKTLAVYRLVSPAACDVGCADIVPRILARGARVMTGHLSRAY